MQLDRQPAKVASSPITPDEQAARQIQSVVRTSIIQHSLRRMDGEAARAFGFQGAYSHSFANALAPAATSIQRHARGRFDRKRIHEQQERSRHRWIEYHLSSRNVAAARALGWVPRHSLHHGQESSSHFGQPSGGPDTAKRAIKSDSAGPQHRAAALDFPRFLAAVHVAAYHAWSTTSTPREKLSNILLWGFAWVPFFFILSGFVLFFSKAQAEGSSERHAQAFGFTGRGAAWSWLWKRWISMYPLFLLSLVLGLWGVPYFTHPEGQWVSVINMLLMLQAWAWQLRCTEHVTL